MKKLITAILCSLVLLCLCGCVEVNLTPVDYGFDFEFLADYKELDFTGYEIFANGFGCTVYCNPKYAETGEVYVHYTVSGAPDCLDPWRLTCIHCTDPEVEFFGGLTLADVEEIKEYLENGGFKIETDGNGFTAKKGRVFVNYVKDKMLVINYQSTNKQHVDF